MKIKLKSREKTKTKEDIIQYEIYYNAIKYYIIETTTINKQGQIVKRFDVYNNDFEELTYSDFGKFLKEQFLHETR